MCEEERTKSVSCNLKNHSQRNYKSLKEISQKEFLPSEDEIASYGQLDKTYIFSDTYAGCESFYIENDGKYRFKIIQ